MKNRLSRQISRAIQWLYKSLNPSQLIVLSFFIMIVLGTGLLALPVATASGRSAGFLTALFTSTSAACVTGLVVVETAAFWSTFGKLVILVLIQIGALGLISVLMIVLIASGEKITLRDRLVIQASLNQENIKGMIRLIRTVIFGTAIIEGIAAVIFTIRFFLLPGVGFGKAVSWGIFHSISAFCNAGFDIMGSDSLMRFAKDPLINWTTMIVAIISGLGFSVWLDVLDHIKFRKKGQRRSLKATLRSFTLHSKLVLSMFAIITVSGTVFFLLSEYNNDIFSSMDFIHKLRASLFHTVSLGGAGFSTVDVNQMDTSSKFVSMILMSIGGAPAATAGGIKTVTVAVLVTSIYSAFKGRGSAQVFNRRISHQNVQKALAVTGMFLGVTILATLILGFSERNMSIRYDFMDLLFEAIAATSNTGLNTAFTPHVSNIGRVVVILCMFFGRTGPMTIVLAINLKSKTRADRLEYPEENVLIG